MLLSGTALILHGSLLTHMTIATKVGAFYFDHINDDAPEVDSFSRGCYQALSSPRVLRREPGTEASCNLSVLLSQNVRVEQYVQTYILLAMVGNICFSCAYSCLRTPLSVSDYICMSTCFTSLSLIYLLLTNMGCRLVPNFYRLLLCLNYLLPC